MNNTHDALLPTDAAAYGRGVSLAVEIVVIVAAVIACMLRVLARLITKAGLGWDDWSICVAAVTTLVTAGVLLAASASNPVGAWVADHPKSSYDYTDADQNYLKLLTVASVLYFTISATTKLGILSMYYRIFARDVHFRRSMYVVGFLVSEWWVGTTIASLTNCIPLERSWVNGLSEEGYCFNFNVFWLASGIVEIVLDVMILVLPVRAVLHLQLSKSNKIRVILIFLLGSFTVVTGIIRVALGYRPDGRVPFHTRAEVWTTVHTGMSIVCACLPIYGPLVRMARKSSLIVAISKICSGLLACGCRHRRGRYQKALSSHETPDSPPFTLKTFSKIKKEFVSYSDTKEMYASAQRELLVTEMPRDIENKPEPAWKPPARKDRFYRIRDEPRVPSFQRLTLNLSDFSLSLNSLRRESMLLPEE